MRSTLRLILLAILLFAPITTFAKTAGNKEAVTIQIDAGLLKRAKAQDLDLASILEKQLQTRLELPPASAASPSYLPFLTKAFDNFETLMFAPLQITAKMSKTQVRTVCKTMSKNIEQLLADAETRKSMPLPSSLEEAKQLDAFIQQRFKAFQNRSAKARKQMQASGKIMQTNCRDLDQDEQLMQAAMKSLFAGYGPVGWCQAMRKKPQAQWSMDDSQKFMKFCTGAK